MAALIDITKLTKQEQCEIIRDILNYNIDIRNAFHKIVPSNEEEVSIKYVEKLMLKHFEEYDEVFRKLA